jgi:hypothetical protein
VARLNDILASRRWLRSSHPFPHTLATNVFTKAFYTKLEGEFRSVLRRSFGPSAVRTPPMYKMTGYDAFAMHIGAAQKTNFRLFLSREWHDLMADVSRVDASGEIDCSLHHHKRGSLCGQVHNDLNPGWFLDEPDADGITVTDQNRCTYCHGVTSSPDLVPVERVRAAAVLFYLNNAPWRKGDGGETGLYYAEHDPIDLPAVRVPPVNNTMLIFECTPFSYHGFLRNGVHPRNSLIMWLHRPKADVAARWGKGKIIGWPKTE